MANPTDIATPDPLTPDRASFPSLPDSDPFVDPDAIAVAPSEQPSHNYASDATLTEDLRLLADEAKAMALAELAFQKSRATFVGAEMRSIVVFLIIAAVLVFFAAMAAIVGTVIALGTLIGPWLSMVVVTAILAIIAIFCALKAKNRVTKMFGILGSEGGL